MINHNDINVIKEYELMKYKYSIYALEHEWLQCSGIGKRSPAYCMTLVTIIIITIKYDKRGDSDNNEISLCI